MRYHIWSSQLPFGVGVFTCAEMVTIILSTLICMLLCNVTLPLLSRGATYFSTPWIWLVLWLFLTNRMYWKWYSGTPKIRFQGALQLPLAAIKCNVRKPIYSNRGWEATWRKAEVPQQRTSTSCQIHEWGHLGSLNPSWPPDDSNYRRDSRWGWQKKCPAESSPNYRIVGKWLLF